MFFLKYLKPRQIKSYSSYLDQFLASIILVIIKRGVFKSFETNVTVKNNWSDLC